MVALSCAGLLRSVLMSMWWRAQMMEQVQGMMGGGEKKQADSEGGVRSPDTYH
jgi:hypothetical protein